MRPRFRPLILCCLAAALAMTALVYWPGLTGGYVFDDFPNIVDNAAIHVTHSTLANWANAAWSSPSSSFRRPLASLTFALNWFFSRGNPGPMKVTNLGIHLLNGVLLYFMLRELLRAWNLRQRTRTLTPAPLPRGEGFKRAFNSFAVSRSAIRSAWPTWPLAPVRRILAGLVMAGRAAADIHRHSGAIAGLAGDGTRNPAFQDHQQQQEPGFRVLPWTSSMAAPE
ncbi:MAG: hypothetical protein ACREMY_20445 [bacterium]